MIYKSHQNFEKIKKYIAHRPLIMNIMFIVYIIDDKSRPLVRTLNENNQRYQVREEKKVL